MIVEKIDLNLDQGTFLTILGPNGAGKTTLLKILSGLVPPTSGVVEFNGRNLHEDSIQVRSRIGVISHRPFLYESLSAWENLYFYGRMYDVGDLDRRIPEILGQVGLELFAREPVGNFSRGMVQRLSIARAIIHDPEALFLDEPFTGLDQQATEILSSVLGRFKTRSRTVVMVTHNFEQALALSDLVMILNRGRMVYLGPVQELDLTLLKELYRRAVEGDR